jgi:hypothetical protein
MNFRQSKPEDFIYIRDNALYPFQNDKEPLDKVFFEYTFEHDAVILGSGGFQILTDATAQCWVQLTKYAATPVIPNLCTMAECMRRIKEYIEIFCETHNIIRLQAWVDCEFEEGRRLVDHLGFHKEVRMMDFMGKGKDAWLYVRLMETE